MKTPSVGKTTIKVGFKGMRRTVDESQMSMEYAKEITNYTVEDDVLTSTLGIKMAQHSDNNGGLVAYWPIPAYKAQVNQLLLYRHSEDGKSLERMITVDDGGHVCMTGIHEDEEWTTFPNILLEGEAFGVTYRSNDKDMFILCSSTGQVHLIVNRTPYVLSKAPKLTCVEVYNDRVFGSVAGVRDRLWFSAFADPTEWQPSSTGAGYIDIKDDNGDIVSLISLKGHLYIFKEFGIYRLTGYADQTEFTVSNVVSGFTRIERRTICRCGDRVVFYANGKLYQFDGYTIKRIGRELPDIYMLDKMACAYLNGVYYLSCNTFDPRVTVPTALIAYNLEKDTYDMLDLQSVRALMSVNTNIMSEVYVIMQGWQNLFSVTNSGTGGTKKLEKLYKSPVNDLGIDALKTVRKVVIETENNITLTVILDDKRYQYPLKGSKSPQRIFVERSGVKIGFELTTNEDYTYVKPLKVTLDVHKN